MTQALVLKPLEPALLELFAQQMQESFQQAISADPSQGQVLPRQDIDQALAKPGAIPLLAWLADQPVGGAVVFPDEVGGHYECAFLYVAADQQKKGLGSQLWAAVEAYFPQAKSWELVTPYQEIGNIHFYLRKCGFVITDLFEDETEEADEEAGPGHNLMLRFHKQLGK